MGTIPNQLNFPEEDYIQYAARLAAMDLEDLAKELYSQAMLTDGRSDRSSNYNGIRKYNKTPGKWEATMKVGGKSIYLGIYDDERQAAQVRNSCDRCDVCTAFT